MCQVVAYERLKTMNKLYNCHLKEWLQWLTRSSNYRSSLTVNIFGIWDWWLEVEVGLY